ncbi:MAG TPA: TIGR02270 family protein [Anaeromyxobacteraceae bacterium]
MRPEAPIRWDIVEEHLDEAGFLRQLWEEALRSPVYTLAEIAAGPEERMLAHLDGLVVAGRRAAEKLLLPALGGDDPGLVFAAAFALLASEDGDFTDAVLAALGEAEPEPRAAIRRALGVVPRADLGARLAALAPRAAPPLQADLLEVLASLRVDPGVRLEPLFAGKSAADRARALRIARAFPGRLDPRAVERGLVDAGAEVRAAAMETGLVTGVRGAAGACEAEVAGRGEAFATAALLGALSGEEKAVAPLVEALGDDDVVGPALFALGFTGRVAAADALLELMERDEKLAPLAAEGFCAISGLVVGKRFERETPPWRPKGPFEDEDETYGPESDLPKPVPETIAGWWKEARPRLDARKRWLRGQPWSVEALVRELEEGPARRREALAAELAIRTKGQVQVAWDALGRRQGRELAEASGAGARASTRPQGMGAR